MSTFPQHWISTTSHWQATNKGPNSLWLHNSNTAVPAAADIVIVGGGMMGAALSYFLTRPGAAGEGKKVVCVEAKDVASGASGRNGGHVGPKTWKMWNDLQKPFPAGAGLSAADAVKVAQSERDNLDLVQLVVEQERLMVDFWRGELFEVYQSAAETTEAKKLYSDWLKTRADMGLTGDDTKFIDDAQEAVKMTRMKGVSSVHSRPAGSVHSHKLATALMRRAIESQTSDFSFFSWTPVKGFPKAAGDGKWTVETTRGDITAPRVILCTNAYTKNFFADSDALHGHIIPVREQCSEITPPPTFSGVQGLRNTYLTSPDYYLVTAASGQLILGGGVYDKIVEGKISPDDLIGQVDDSAAGINKVLTQDHAAYMHDHFVNWGQEGYGEGLSRTWVGILSTVKDHLPLVGEVPGQKGVSLCAGFSGHGMSRIFVTARGYADTLKTGTWDESLLPASYQLTEERLAATQKAEAAYKAEHGRVPIMLGSHQLDTVLPGASVRAATPHGQAHGHDDLHKGTAVDFLHKRVARLENVISHLVTGMDDRDIGEPRSRVAVGSASASASASGAATPIHKDDPRGRQSSKTSKSKTSSRDTSRNPSGMERLENAIARILGGYDDHVGEEASRDYARRASKHSHVEHKDKDKEYQAW